jgi:mRNA interferase MazF
MEQGDIYLINLDPGLHTEVGKTRPGVILSVNAMNLNSPRVIIAPITSKTNKLYPFEILLLAGMGGVKRESKIMVDQVRSIDKRRLIRKVGSVEKELLTKAYDILKKLLSPQ